MAASLAFHALRGDLRPLLYLLRLFTLLLGLTGPPFTSRCRASLHILRHLPFVLLSFLVRANLQSPFRLLLDIPSHFALLFPILPHSYLHLQLRPCPGCSTLRHCDRPALRARHGYQPRAGSFRSYHSVLSASNFLFKFLPKTHSVRYRSACRDAPKPLAQHCFESATTATTPTIKHPACLTFPTTQPQIYLSHLH